MNNDNLCKWEEAKGWDLMSSTAEKEDQRTETGKQSKRESDA